MSKRPSFYKKKNLVTFVTTMITVAIVGVTAGLAGAFLGALLMKGRVFGFGALAGGFTGLIIGYPVGAVIGIILISKTMHHRGSLLFAITGIFLGTLLTSALPVLLHLNFNPDIFLEVFITAVAVLGTTGFYLRR